MDPISIEDLALLEVLQRIDQSVPLQSGDTEIHQRLIESGLVVVEDTMPRLTLAGVEMTKSLQHRVAADAQAAKILDKPKAHGAQAGTAASGGRVSGA
ncbi:hypothetical protein BH23PSE2_BH23PSE2_07450 [soil metagenome]